MSSINVSLGLIIGKTTHNSVRILVEFDKGEDVVCYMTSEKGVKQCKLRSKAGVPVVFSFTALEPKTFYKVSLSCKLSIKSSFSTLRDEQEKPGNLRVAVISCNDMSEGFHKTEKTDIHKKVKRNELDYVFHIDDQVYMDKPNSKGSKDDPYSEGSPARCSSNKYRKTWGLEATAKVLANVPNLMICDDHEVRDDWGFRPEDYTEGTTDNFYGGLARQVYYEYQRQLREDIDWNNPDSLKCEYYHCKLNGVGVVFTEYRGCRTWFREEEVEKDHFGKNQTEWLNQFFKEQGEFDTLDSVLFISPLPMFFLSHIITKLVHLIEDDAQEEWAYDAVPEMGRVLDLLRLWRERRPSKKMILLGGDVHFGGPTDVFYQNKLAFKQLTSSAINSRIVSRFEEAVTKLAMRVDDKLSNGYYFKHHGWKKENNYDVVEVTNKNGVSKIDSTLVYYSDKNGLVQTKIDDQKEPKPCIGCEMF